MGDKSNIEWTDASWNPIRGCTKVSAGCDNCYAMRQAHRMNHPGGAYEGLTRIISGRPQWNGKIRLVPNLLDQPLRWTKPRMIFVDSMSDLFHKQVPFQFIADVFAVMSVTTRHTYQLLTKRAERMHEFFQWLQDGPLDEWDDPERFDPLRVWPGWVPMRGNRGGYDNCGPAWPNENTWLGVSVEDWFTAHDRISVLEDCPAAVRWVSAEPLLEYMTFPWRSVDWVVVGGESGPGARQFDPDWVRQIRDDIAGTDCRLFVKQLGSNPVGLKLKDRKGGDMSEWPEDIRVRDWPAKFEGVGAWLK